MMPLDLNPKAAWPPQGWTSMYTKYAEWSAWYSGDAQTICDYYTGVLTRFWGKSIPVGERRVALHVPLAGDIAATSADLLFGERPKIIIPDPDAGHNGRSTPAVAAAQTRLDTILADADAFSRLQEAAEAASALSAVVLKVDWDKSLADHPFLSVVHADSALPEFTYGLLRACTLWRVVEYDGATVWRHLERHELDANGDGIILHALYRGTSGTIGQSVPLSYHRVTAALPPVTRTGVPGLVCRYIPNMRPNRLWRWTYLGQSDYSGSEGLFDSLDETMSNWQRDVRLGKGRILAPDRYFQRDTETGKMTFDADAEVYVRINAPPSPEGLKDELAISQFAIRAAEHEQTALQLIIHAITNAGYSPQTFGVNVKGQAESGTALDIRRDKSYRTTAKKAEYWRDALADLCEIMLIVDRLHLGSAVEPMRPQVEMQDGSMPSVGQMAETVLKISQAQAASTQVLVELLHPDWSVEQVAEEVERITSERQATVPDLAKLGLDEGGTDNGDTGGGA